MPEARSWARLGGCLGIAWPILFIVVMVAAEMTSAPTHSAAEELAALGQPHVGRVGMLLHSLAAIIGLLGIGWAVALNSVLQSERRLTSELPTIPQWGFNSSPKTRDR